MKNMIFIILRKQFQFFQQLKKKISDIFNFLLFFNDFIELKNI